ncbi:uncharacterized protein KY384_003773 [Bacidia gigantensis]|uniref:uncharacterized protein n=1 Tax=Bacidia gigantensis TaxID=2732470 RepID=UPI001D050362|nr:uncharacterized protein KY384_003773 [Bacidia gigantensis]KAG8532134.1 hypothetical protein KY384_003773 [Bacidia gigantensis]
MARSPPSGSTDIHSNPPYLIYASHSPTMDMEQMFGGGGGGQPGQIGQFPLEQWFYEMPVCTRWWTSATIATSILVQCHIITPFQLFYSFRAVFVKNQVRQYSHSSSAPLSRSLC